MSRACAERISVTSEIRTTPPPGGAKDMYSAPTRVGTLPENVLEAMRDRQTPDEQVVATRYVRPFEPALPAPPPLPVVVPASSRVVRVLWTILVVTAFGVLGAAVAVLVVAR